MKAPGYWLIVGYMAACTTAAAQTNYSDFQKAEIISSEQFEKTDGWKINGYQLTDGWLFRTDSTKGMQVWTSNFCTRCPAGERSPAER